MRQTIRPIILVLVVATSASAEPFNPYAPTPGWSPPPDIWSQPAPVQPSPPGDCSPFNPYAGRCDATVLAPLAVVAPFAPSAPPPLDDELEAPIGRYVITGKTWRIASTPDAPREAVPEPGLALMMGLTFLAVAGRWQRRNATRQD